VGGEAEVDRARQDASPPGLHFVGYQVTLGGTVRLVGIQVKQLARGVAASRPRAISI
jgi:hypothetical protein